MHFLQSPAWRTFQKQLGRKTFHQTGNDWEYLAILEHGTGNTRLYCPYGPVAKTQKALEEAIASLIVLGAKHNATFLRIEPTNPKRARYLESNGWKRVTYQSLNPEHSRIIDLSLSEEELVANMSQPARNIYRNYHKKGVEVVKSTDPSDIKILTNLLDEVSARTGMTPHSHEYFQAQADSLFPIGAASLLYATQAGQPIAAALFYDSEDTRYYAHAAASLKPEYRKLNAGTAIVAEAIIDAKRQGLSNFDLYGIAPEGSDKNHPWFGFTKFKRSFGGEDISFAGSWDFPLKSLSYKIYRAYQTIRK